MVCVCVLVFHCSLKGRAFRLSSESETGLRQVLQDPLHGFSQWSQMVSQVLEASAEVSEFSHIALLVQNIEVKHPAFAHLSHVQPVLGESQPRTRITPVLEESQLRTRITPVLGESQLRTRITPVALGMGVQFLQPCG